jgi:hypothetical protein
MNKRTGYVFKKNGAWWTKVTATDPTTRKRKQYLRRGPTKSEACERRDELLRTPDRGKQPERRGKSFADLATYNLARFAQPAEWVGDRKVAGLRSHREVAVIVAVLNAAFGQQLLTWITYGDIDFFRRDRLRIPTRAGRQRSIARVNRERLESTAKAHSLGE